MSADPLLAIAPARVKAQLLPLGRIKSDRFASFVQRLHGEYVVHLRDISANGRPNRNMFSPLAYPDGAILYDFITHAPSPSHLALSPFDLYREPMAVIALADGRELSDAAFSKRHSVNDTGPTMVAKNIRALYQELEGLRDNYPKVLVHWVVIFDFTAGEVPIPEGMTAIPPIEECKRTTMRTVMCDISSTLLAEMTTLARSFEAMTVIESPGHYSLAKETSGGAWGSDATSSPELLRRNSQYSLPKHVQRSNSTTSIDDRAMSRMSMPPTSSQQNFSSTSTPARPSTPVQGGHPPGSSDGPSSLPGTNPSSPRQKPAKPDGTEEPRDRNRERMALQGFGPGGANDRWRLRAKGRASVVIGSMYLQAGRWSDSLRELSEGATTARSQNDHIWHGKALELILMNLLLLAWSGLEFQIPPVCLPPQDRSSSYSMTGVGAEIADLNQPQHLRHLQGLLPELLDRILGLYSRISAENLPPLPFAERIIGFSKILAALHMCEGRLDQRCLDMIVTGKRLDKDLTTSPRLLISPSRQQILNFLFRAFPSIQTELLTTVDRVSILSGIASILGPLGYHRKKAMVIRELVSVLIGGLVEARTRGAAEAGVHPAAGLIALTPGDAWGTGAMALDLSEGDVEQGIEAFLELLCKSYGIVGFDQARPRRQSLIQGFDDSDAAVIARIRSQLSSRFFGFTSIKLNILRACINFSEALPDFNGVLKFSSDLMRTAGSGVAPGPRHEDASPMIHRDEQVRLVTNISRTSNLVQRLGMTHLAAEFWDEFLVREVRLEPLPSTRVPIPHARSVLPGATAARSSQDVNPFIYNPFLKEPDETAAANLVAGELARFTVTLQNTYDVELNIESIRLETEGVDFEALTESAVIGPYRTQALRLQGRAREEGCIQVTGAIIKVRGCRERRFAIWPKAWTPAPEAKVKGRGRLEPYSLSLNVIRPQPLVTVKSTSLPQSSVMILEGERQTFSVTLQNTSTTAVDFMLFSFKDSTQEPLQAALSSREATPAEIYEYELILMKKQALRLPRKECGRCIAPGGEATFEFEMLGKAGLTQATIQVDYTCLGGDGEEQFYTRQLMVDVAVTVNASVELTRIDAISMREMPLKLWGRLGGMNCGGLSCGDEYWLLLMDLRNAWPSQLAVRVESKEGIAVDEDILPGKTTRILMPIKRIYLEDPHAALPSLSPRNRQFVVSSSRISPEVERAQREAFWYRERILGGLEVTWRGVMGERKGGVELRSMRLTTRMIDVMRVAEVDVEVWVEPQYPVDERQHQVDEQPLNSEEQKEKEEEVAESQQQREKEGMVAENQQGESQQQRKGVAYVDEFMQVKVRIRNQTKRPIYPLVRVVPSLCHRANNVALDYTRKFAWNGTLQQRLAVLEGGGEGEFSVGVTALCRGSFEIMASVEEVMVWDDIQDDYGEDGEGRGKVSGENGEDDGKDTRGEKTGEMEKGEMEKMENARGDIGGLGVRERRMWHSRQPFLLTVRDRE